MSSSLNCEILTFKLSLILFSLNVFKNAVISVLQFFWFQITFLEKTYKSLNCDEHFHIGTCIILHIFTFLHFNCDKRTLFNFHKFLP